MRFELRVKKDLATHLTIRTLIDLRHREPKSRKGTRLSLMHMSSVIMQEEIHTTAMVARDRIVILQ